MKRFKREYRQLVYAQNMTRERMERNSAENVNGTGGGASSGGKKDHDNSFWRSKVNNSRRFTVTSNATPTATSSSGRSTSPTSVNTSSLAVPSLDESIKESTKGAPAPVNHEDDSFWDPLNDAGTSSTSSTSPVPSTSSSSYTSSSSGTIDDSFYEPSSSSSSSSDYEYFSGGIFSSVFDVAREAVSILNGPSYTGHHNDSSSSTSPHAQQSDTATSSSSSSGSNNGSLSPTRGTVKRCNTSIHLVDTLYLF